MLFREGVLSLASVAQNTEMSVRAKFGMSRYKISPMFTYHRLLKMLYEVTVRSAL